MNENMKALGSYRIEQADESLAAARLLLDNGLDRPSVNSSYYAMFFAVLALLATRKEETSKHSGAIALFDKEFVKTGAFSKDLSRSLHDAFDLRQQSDFAYQVHVSKEKARETLEQARTFVSRVKCSLME